MPAFAELEQDRLERLKINQRVRTFAWSQSLPPVHTIGQSGACDTIGQPFLAVSTESGNLYIIELQSPHSVFSDSTTWDATVTHSFPFQTKPSHSTGLSFLPPSSVRQKPLVDQLAWSPWSKDAKGTLSSVLAFTSQEALQCIIIRAATGLSGISLQIGTAVPHLVDDKVARAAGAMCWMPKPTNEEELYLVYPCRKMIYCLVFHLKKASAIRPTRCELENTWDELSGMSSRVSPSS